MPLCTVQPHETLTRTHTHTPTTRQILSCIQSNYPNFGYLSKISYRVVILINTQRLVYGMVNGSLTSMAVCLFIYWHRCVCVFFFTRVNSWGARLSITISQFNCAHKWRAHSQVMYTDKPHSPLFIIIICDIQPHVEHTHWSRIPVPPVLAYKISLSL